VSGKKSSPKVRTRPCPAKIPSQKPGHGRAQEKILPKKLDTAYSAPKNAKKRRIPEKPGSGGSLKVWILRNPIRKTPEKPGCGGIQSARLLKNPDAAESNPQDSAISRILRRPTQKTAKKPVFHQKQIKMAG